MSCIVNRQHCENTSVVQSETRTMVLHSGGQQIASNPWSVSVSKNKFQYVWKKNIILWETRWKDFYSRCDAWKTNSFAALIRSLYIYNKLWMTIVHICDVNLIPPSLPDHNLTAGVFGLLNLNIKSPRNDGSFARFFLSCRPCCEYLN